MSPEAEKFVADVRERVDPELADLIKGELERGVNLYAMKELLRTQIAAKRAMDAATPSNGRGEAE